MLDKSELLIIPINPSSHYKPNSYIFYITIKPWLSALNFTSRQTKAFSYIYLYFKNVIRNLRKDMDKHMVSIQIANMTKRPS